MTKAQICAAALQFEKLVSVTRAWKQTKITLYIFSELEYKILLHMICSRVIPPHVVVVTFFDVAYENHLQNCIKNIRG